MDLSDLSEALPLIAWLDGRARRYCVLDLTTDLGIPVYAALSARADGRDVALGAAAHFDSRRAVIAALTEMLQCEISLNLRRARPAGPGDAFQDWIDTVTRESPSHLAPLNGSAARVASDATQILSASQAIDRCLGICRDAGLDLLVVDLTRAAVGVPVVRVVVPGLRPGRTRLAPGRLHDIPVKLGWCAEHTRHADLNQIPLSI